MDNFRNPLRILEYNPLWIVEISVFISLVSFCQMAFSISPLSRVLQLVQAPLTFQVYCW